MSKDWRTILRFAVMGIGIAIVFLVFDKTDFFAKNWAGIYMFWASLAICPAFFVLALDEAGSELLVSDAALVWVIIGLSNCLFYAVVGAASIGLHKPRGGMFKI